MSSTRLCPHQICPLAKWTTRSDGKPLISRLIPAAQCDPSRRRVQAGRSLSQTKSAGGGNAALRGCRGDCIRRHSANKRLSATSSSGHSNGVGTVRVLPRHAPNRGRLSCRYASLQSRSPNSSWPRHASIAHLPGARSQTTRYPLRRLARVHWRGPESVSDKLRLSSVAFSSSMVVKLAMLRIAIE